MLDLQAIREAQARIAPYVHRTPVIDSRTLNEAAGANLHFKCENFQKIGAFKARGAHNAVFSLSEAEAARGVVTHSSGNHAAALALAARNRGIPSHIVMPDNAPKAKIASVERQGAQPRFCPPTMAGREAAAAQLLADTGGTLIHPYNDLRVMAGQGTVALELLETQPELDLILCPVGGGGLLSGVAVAAKALKPGIRVVAVEPAGADDAYRSFKARAIRHDGERNTVADGLRASIGELPFQEILRHVDDIVTVSEAGIVQAMRTIWSVLKIVVEPSAAVAYAALAEGRLDVRGQHVGIILTGGNLDLDRLPWSPTA